MTSITVRKEKTIDIALLGSEIGDTNFVINAKPDCCYRPDNVSVEFYIWYIQVEGISLPVCIQLSGDYDNDRYHLMLMKYSSMGVALEYTDVTWDVHEISKNSFLDIKTELELG